MAVDTPTAAVPPAPPVRTASRVRLVVAGVVVLGALAFLLLRLGDATVYFRTADEAVAQRTDLGDRRFRIEGAVVPGSVREAGGEVTFQIEENGAVVDVRHQGDPPELFRDGIPVVLEGRWDGQIYRSDRIMVKHTSSYRADNPERVKDYPAEQQ